MYLREFTGDGWQFLEKDFPVSRLQALRRVITLLRSVNTEPDFMNLGPAGPESGEVGEVSGPSQHGSGNCAVHRDPLPGDMFQNAIIGGWRAPLVMLGR